MSRELDFSREAAKFLEKIPPKHARPIAVKVKELLDEPLPKDSIRMQNNRIVYEFDQDTVRIPVVGRRNDGEVYKKAKRKQ